MASVGARRPQREFHELKHAILSISSALGVDRAFAYANSLTLPEFAAEVSGLQRFLGTAKSRVAGRSSDLSGGSWHAHTRSHTA